MGDLLVNERDIVTPGEILATGMDYLPATGAFREEENIVSSQLGMVNISGRLIKIVPLGGPYVPKRGDTVIGRISDVNYSNWFVDIGYAYEASLTMKEATSSFIPRGAELTDIFKLNDLVVTGIINVTKAKAMDITMRGPGFKKLVGGKLVSVPSAKIPRVVGKAGSMINMIKEMTDCNIIAGQNGRIWVSGKDPASERLAVEAIRLIEAEAHLSGLTDRVKGFIESSRGERK